MAIASDNLIAYLDDVIASPSEDITEAQLEHYKAQLQVWVEENKRGHASDLEMFKSVITSGQNALRTAFLLNGGAAVAILAFLGKLSDHHTDKIPLFASSLIIFVSGVLAIAIASGFTYLSQWIYAESGKWQYSTGLTFNILAIILGLSSYGLFIWAMYRAYYAFLFFA